MNRFALLLTEELEREGIGLGELPELLLEAGADDYDALPGSLVAVLTATPDNPGIGWHPDTWNALREVLGDPPKDRILSLLKAFYFVDTDEEGVA
jgi:hypothetical protein